MSVKSANKNFNLSSDKFIQTRRAALFPRIYKTHELPNNNKLKSPKVTSIQKKLSEKELSVEFVVQDTNCFFDVYMFVNNQKQDMFYSVPYGAYCFRNLKLRKGKNSLQLFCVQNGFKSKTVSLEVTI